MIGETIKWKIKIVNLINHIYLGIGLRTVLKNNGFQLLDGTYDKHGCYIVRQDGSALTYMDQ